MEGHLAARFPAEASPGSERVGLADLVADHAARLRVAHERIVAQGTPGQAAAHYLGDWFAGSVAGAVGFGLAAGGCGFVVDPEELRWRTDPEEGWPEAVALGRLRSTLVLPAHPWAGRADVEVVDTAGEVIDRSMQAVVDAVGAVIEACRTLARVGRPGMWNEVGDGVGSLLGHQDLVAVTPAMVEVLEAAVRVDGVPWKARPSFRLPQGRSGPRFVLQKGGCCLAYTREEWPAEPADEDLDDALRAYRDAFPNPLPGEPWYCSNCSFRAAEDCDARVVLWHELSHPVL